MTQLTIDLNEDVKEELLLLAKKRNSSVSDLIRELIKKERNKLNFKPSKKGLGTYLTELPINEVPDFKNDKEFLEKLKEEKHLHENIH